MAISYVVLKLSRIFERGGGQNLPPPPAGRGLINQPSVSLFLKTADTHWSTFSFGRPGRRIPTIYMRYCSRRRRGAEMGDTPPVFPFSQRRVVNRFRYPPPPRKRMVADGRSRSHGNKSSGPNQTSGRKALIVENQANCRLKINEGKGQIGPCDQDVEIPGPGFATRWRPTCPLPG